MVEVGDECINKDHRVLTITSVLPGVYGLLLRGYYVDGQCTFEAYLPAELLPTEGIKWGWHGWSDYTALTLPSGAKVGMVGRHWSDLRNSVSDYDAAWKRTIKAMKAEEGVMQSRPTSIRMN